MFWLTVDSNISKLMSPINIKHPVLFLAFGFGSGLSPKAPGTMGSLLALPLFFLLTLLPLWAYWAVLVLATVAGIWLCGRAAQLLGVHDHAGIVWDEFVGQWLALTVLLPVAAWSWSTVAWVALGFGLFRLFDILKPWPISWCDEHVHGGFGIMIDDILAGILAGLVLALAYYGVDGWI